MKQTQLLIKTNSRTILKAHCSTPGCYTEEAGVNDGSGGDEEATNESTEATRPRTN